MFGEQIYPAATIDAAKADSFATPFTLTTRTLTSRMEIHATQIENALLGNLLVPATRVQNIGLISVLMLLAMPLLLFWHPLRSALFALVLAAASVCVSFWLFKQHGTWVTTFTPLAGLLTAFMATGAGSFLTERRRAGQIRAAFAKYVSAEVVEEMIAHPERLTLGGQRRDISVLFCDLAGFTSVSEKLAPEVVGQLAGLYLKTMTRIIMSHRGTVDKFSGDGVMAFWGAPLDDAEHATHALQAAIEMQQAMRDLQPEFLALGIAELALRIGISSGPAIVGNMGSEERFDYTAIGDVVNLASRLEAANKAYATGILAAQSTVERVADRFPMRLIDRVRVKGKQRPVEVYSPCADDTLITATERCWQSYLARDWNTTHSHIEALREIDPEDAVASMLERRVTQWQAQPPPADWDGSVALEKL